MVWTPWKKYQKKIAELEREVAQYRHDLSNERVKFDEAFQDVSGQAGDLRARLETEGKKVSFLEGENTDLKGQKAALEERIKELETDFEAKKEGAATNYCGQVLDSISFYATDQRCNKAIIGECFKVAKELLKESLAKAQKFFQYCHEVERKASGTSYGLLFNMSSSELTTEEKFKLMEYIANEEAGLKGLGKPKEVDLKKFYQERINNKV